MRLKVTSLLLIISVFLSCVTVVQAKSADLDLTTESEYISLNEKQKAYMMSLGVEEDKLNSLTQSELHEYILEGEIIYPEYIEKYVSKTFEERMEDIKQNRRNDYDFFVKLGYNEREIEMLLSNGVIEYQNIDEDKEYYDLILSKISKEQDQVSFVSLSSSYDHLVYGISDILTSNGGRNKEPDPCAFNHDTFDDYYGSSFTDTYGTVCTEGTGYEKKLSYMKKAVMAAGNIAEGMYHDPNTTASYNYNIYGERTGSKYHEGYDIANGSVDLYTPNENCYVIGYGEKGGITWVSLYLADLSISVTYEHLDYSNYISLLEDSKNNYRDISGKIFARESSNGANSTHTHVEFNKGKHAGMRSNSNSTLECYDPLRVSFLVY